MSIFSKYIQSSASSKKGFTLIELLVVISISAIVMTALVVQQRRWDDQLALNTQTYELALMLRQAQIYSLGVREDLQASGDRFDIGYGVYIDQALLNRYTFFADRNKNSLYDPTGGEAIETKILRSGFYMIPGGIDKDLGTTYWANNSIGRAYVYKVSMSFKRPDPNAILRFINFSSDNTTALLKPQVIIRMISPQGRSSYIDIFDNGQISIR